MFCEKLSLRELFACGKRAFYSLVLQHVCFQVTSSSSSYAQEDKKKQNDLTASLIFSCWIKNVNVNI